MKFHLRFLAFALGAGLAFVAPTAAQAQVSVGVNIGLPAWGPPVPQGTQYYYIPEIDGYYDIYNGVYIVFDGTQWIQMPYLDGYDPYYFHPYPVSYVGAQPWLYISTYRNRYPQYVTGFRRGGYGGGRYYDRDYGAGRVYGYDHSRGGYDNRGRINYGGANNGGRPVQGAGFPGNAGGINPSRGNVGGFPGGQPNPGRGGFGGGQANPGGGRPNSIGGQTSGGGQHGGFGGVGGPRGGGNPGGGGGRHGGR